MPDGKSAAGPKRDYICSGGFCSKPGASNYRIIRGSEMGYPKRSVGVQFLEVIAQYTLVFGVILLMAKVLL
jgi:hypothetical protein